MSVYSTLNEKQESSQQTVSNLYVAIFPTRHAPQPTQRSARPANRWVETRLIHRLAASEAHLIPSSSFHKKEKHTVNSHSYRTATYGQTLSWPTSLVNHDIVARDSSCPKDESCTGYAVKHAVCVFVAVGAIEPPQQQATRPQGLY